MTALVIFFFATFLGAVVETGWRLTKRWGILERREMRWSYRFVAV